MKIKTYEKPIITKFVEIDGEKFKFNELCASLEQILNQTIEDDKYGDYSLRGYELYYPDVMSKLVKMGLVKNYTGSRMADLYCMKNEKGINNLLDMLYESYR